MPPAAPARAGTAVRPARGAVVVAAVVLLVAAVALAVALPGLDRRARAAGTTAVAEALQRELGLPEPPEVVIGGRWFLLQALRGRYDGGTVATGRLARDGVVLRGLRADLRDVRVPLTVLLGRRDGAVDVGSGTARALVPWWVLEERATAASGRAVRLAADGADVRATTTVDLLGRDVELALSAAPRVGGTSIRLRPSRVDLAGRTVDVDDLRSLLGRAGLDGAAPLLEGVEVPLDGAGGLPPGVRLRSVAVREGGVVGRADLRDLSFPLVAAGGA